MPIDTALNTDLSAPELCNFLARDYSTDTYTDEVSATDQWIADGYHKAADRLTLANAEKLFLQTYEVTTFDVRTADNRPLPTVDVADAVEHRLLMQVKAYLLLKPDLTADLADAITKAFEQTDPNDASKAEADLIRTGASIDDYVVCLGIQLVQGQPKVVSTVNRDAFRNQIAHQSDSSGKLLYRVEWNAINAACHWASNENSGDHVVICDNVDHPDDCLEKSANEKHPHCDGLAVTKHRIGTAFQYNEWRTVSKKQRIKIGRCWTWLWVPTVQTRLTKQALWGSVQSKQQIKDYFEKALRDCLESAAISTAILILVTGGEAIAVAAKVFVTAVMQCLEKKVTTAVDCLFADLELVKEPGDWEDKWW